MTDETKTMYQVVLVTSDAVIPVNFNRPVGVVAIIRQDHPPIPGASYYFHKEGDYGNPYGEDIGTYISGTIIQECTLEPDTVNVPWFQVLTYYVTVEEVL